MANTFSALHYHIVFSTKNREDWIDADVETKVWAYLAGIARENKMKAIQIGGMPDHIHMALGFPTTLSVSEAVKRLKGGSSAWIKDEFPRMGKFAWQDGYAAFTVSKSNLNDVVSYIHTQREHHRVKSFQEEYRAFLDRHQVDYDEKYLWD